MLIQEEILKKYEEFTTFLESIHIEELKKQFSRTELIEFESKLQDIKVRSFSYEISKVIEEMKKEEFPQLLGVHHYPELIEIDFMSESKKIELDKHLCMIQKGQYVFLFWKFTQDTGRLIQFLLEKGIIGKVYHLTCPHHSSQKSSKALTMDKVMEIKEAINNKNDSFLEGFYENLYCYSCEDGVEYREWHEKYVKEEYILIKERDSSLDNA